MRYLSAACAASVLLLSACSSGGGGSTPTPSSTQPVAATSASPSTSSAAASSHTPGSAASPTVNPAFTGSTIKVSDLTPTILNKGSKVVPGDESSSNPRRYNRDLNAVCMTLFGKPSAVAASTGHKIQVPTSYADQFPAGAIILGVDDWLPTYTSPMASNFIGMSWIGTPGWTHSTYGSAVPTISTTGKAVLCGYGDQAPVAQDNVGKVSATATANEFAIMPGTVEASAVPGYVAGKNNVMVKHVAGATLVAESFISPLAPATATVLDKAAAHLS